MPRIAVFGCGRIGRMHADNLARHPRIELASVFDVVADAAERADGRGDRRLFFSKWLRPSTRGHE